MDHRAEAAEFLRTRRDRIAPDEAGIVGGGRRRVPGLRRKEVALLAGCQRRVLRAHGTG